MSLNGVCELSSLLRVDDSERSNLSHQKMLLELAIKQQEGRVRIVREEFFIFFLILSFLNELADL
mgnify:CR=1 FL=1